MDRDQLIIAERLLTSLREPRVKQNALMETTFADRMPVGIAAECKMRATEIATLDVLLADVAYALGETQSA